MSNKSFITLLLSSIFCLFIIIITLNIKVNNYRLEIEKNIEIHKKETTHLDNKNAIINIFRQKLNIDEKTFDAGLFSQKIETLIDSSKTLNTNINNLHKEKNLIYSMLQNAANTNESLAVEIAFLKNENLELISELIESNNTITQLEYDLQVIRIDTLTVMSPENIEIQFIGRVKNDSISGIGFGLYKGHGYYYGQWIDNMRHGQGTHYYKNGDKYVGSFSYDVRKGYGEYYYKSGEVYKGEWDNNIMNGNGTIILQDGSTKNGNWKNGLIE